MALESSSSWIAQEHQKNSEQQQFITNSVNSQQRHSSKASSKHHTQTERFTQTEYRANCAEVLATSHKDSVMFEQTVHQPQAVPVQIYSTIEKKDIAQDKANVTEFPFCYNVNMLQKVHQTQSGGPTAAAVATISNDDKACYRFDVAQPFGYNYALVNQMSLAAAASTATFKCDICGLVFAHLSLLNHHKRIHNNSSDISPERTFPNEQQPIGKSNNKTGTMEKSRSCNRCGGEVVDCEHSNGGKKKVSKYVKCENCQAGPTSTTTTTTTNGSFPTSPPEPTDSPSEIVTVSSKGLQLVKRHGLATVTKCHKCNGSGIIFVGGAQPPSTPDKPFRCNLCDGSFSRYSSLWSHKRLHSGDKPFKCELCGLTFARAAYLKNHIRVHSGEKPYKCNVCGMQFSQSPHLKNHERIHSGERPYQCEVCQKTFARHSTLWNHRRIHTGEKPYRCTVCGSAFNQATHLKNHAKVHTGEKPHHCDICEVGFSDRFALKRHKLIHEKYGRTSGNTQSAAQPTSNSQNQQTGTQMGDMYKCEVAFPGQQPNSSNSQTQQTTQLEMYKCEVATSVAFPPLPRQALQTNSGRAQQQTDVPVYKCDDGTTVTFPVQQQTQQPTQSNTSTPQTTQISEVYKVDVGNNTLSYPNQPNQQQNGSNPTLSQQQPSQMNDMYKYDVETSVSFPGQSQQSTTQQPNSSTNSQQISQYDIGNTTSSFSSQAQQNQQTSSQPHSAPQQIPEIKTGSFTREPESILGIPEIPVSRESKDGRVVHLSWRSMTHVQLQQEAEVHHNTTKTISSSGKEQSLTIHLTSLTRCPMPTTLLTTSLTDGHALPHFMLLIGFLICLTVGTYLFFGPPPDNNMNCRYWLRTGLARYTTKSMHAIGTKPRITHLVTAAPVGVIRCQIDQLLSSELPERTFQH